MVILDLLEGVTPTVDVWKYAYSTCGELCVITTGPAQMPEWHANSWDTLATVHLPTPMPIMVRVGVPFCLIMWPVLEWRML